MRVALSFAELRRAFVTRLLEWYLAVALMGWGFVLLLPTETYSNSAAWDAFRLILTEDQFGWSVMLVGIARFVVLCINGAWRPAYRWRAVFACAGATLWFSISLGFISASWVGLWLAFVPAAFVFEIVNMLRAISDAAAADRAHYMRTRKEGGGDGSN
jgi:hypothetical protein